MEVLWSVWGSYNTIWGPPLPNVTRHPGWWPHTVTPSIDKTLRQFWPLLIWTLLPNLTIYLIVQGFHRTYATEAACQQRPLTPPKTWSCHTLGLACVLMSRPISPELVLSPDFWISNIPRYFSFALKRHGIQPLFYFIAISECKTCRKHTFRCKWLQMSSFNVILILGTDPLPFHY